MTPLLCLLVEDAESDAGLVLHELRAAGYDVTAERVEAVETMRSALDRQSWDIVIADSTTPQFSGLAALKLIQEKRVDLPLIIVSGEAGEEQAVAAMKEGAHDYVMKGKLTRLGTAVGQALEQSRLRRERAAMVDALRQAEAKYRSIFENAHEGILQSSQEGRVLTVNPALAGIFGFPSVEVFLREVPNIIALYADGSLRSRLVEELKAAGSVSNFEVPMRRRDGKLIWVSNNIKLVRDEQGGIHFEGTIQDITDRKQAEEAMRLQSAALTAAANAIVITTRDGAIVWANQAFTALTGYALAEVAGKNPREVVKSGQHDRAFYQQMWDTVLAGGVWRGELINRCKDGSLYHEEMTITPVRDARGGITHFIAIKQDLSERRRAEITLRESETLLREAQSLAGLGSYVLDLDSGQWNSSDVLDRVLGIGPDDDRTVAGWLALVHPDDRSMMEAHFLNDVVAQRGPFNSEYRIIRRNDHVERWVSGMGRLEFDANGRAVKMRGTIQDITERKQSEAELRRERDLFTSLITTIPDRIYFKDRESRFVRVNESLSQLFGLADPAAAIGKRDRDFFSPEHARQAFAEEQRIMAAGEPMIGKIEKETWPDGHITWVSSTKMPLRDAQGRITGLVGLSRDITEQKLIEEKFLHAQRLESIGMLAAGIAHDLNNVLAPMMFVAPMLRESLSGEHDLKILDTLERSAQRGAALVKQILGFAHTTTGEFRPTQVKHLARDIISVIEETFPKSIEFTHAIPTDLWLVQGNATQIHQVLLNLCVNARDAMPQGGSLSITAVNRQITVKEAAAITDGRPGDFLMLTVSDTGSGIAPEVLEKIWMPFFTTKEVGKGTGLGLTTIRSIVTSHHGFITLDTQVGRGTSFNVYLPAAERAEPKRQSVSPFADYTGHGELVLVADDDVAIRNLVAAILGKFGYQVLKCADGLEAINVFNEQPNKIDLVITDIDMPRLGGAALAGVLRELCPQMPVLAISGRSYHDEPSPDIPAVHNMVQGFLVKPFTADELLANVHTLLHRVAIT